MCGARPNHPTVSTMHMSFEKIDPPEHPAARAAKMIKQLHLDTIAKADAGFVFEREGKDVTFEVVDACMKQVDMCDSIIARADQMPADISAAAFAILTDLEEVVDSKKPMKVLPDEPPQELPEIGNYDHKKTE